MLLLLLLLLLLLRGRGCHEEALHAEAGDALCEDGDAHVLCLDEGLGNLHAGLAALAHNDYVSPPVPPQPRLELLLKRLGVVGGWCV